MSVSLLPEWLSTLFIVASYRVCLCPLPQHYSQCVGQASRATRSVKWHLQREREREKERDQLRQRQGEGGRSREGFMGIHTTLFASFRTYSTVRFCSLASAALRCVSSICLAAMGMCDVFVCQGLGTNWPHRGVWP